MIEGRKAMIGIYVNSAKGINYAEAIVKGYKTIETRTRDTLKSLFKSSDTIRVAIIDTSAKTPVIVGFVTLHKGYKVNRDEFRTDKYYNRHLVPEGSKYDIKPGAAFKWCYEITEAVSCCESPRKVPETAVRHGRTFCEF